MYIIKGRDEPKQLHLSLCFMVLMPGSLNPGTGCIWWKTQRVVCAHGQGPSSMVVLAPRHCLIFNLCSQAWLDVGMVGHWKEAAGGIHQC